MTTTHVSPADTRMAIDPSLTRAGTAEADTRLQRGAHTREVILHRAMEIASLEGLNGLTIGRVANDLDVSKSGLFAHFGSKEEFQLATVEAAEVVFADRVVVPALKVAPGFRQVWAMCDCWLRYSSEQTFPGGCFFVQVSAEFDAIPGRVRDAIAAARLKWIRRIERAVQDAKQVNEVRSDVDSAQLAFELDALAAGAGGAALLYDDPSMYDRGRRAMWSTLRACATEPSDLPAAAPPPGRRTRRQATRSVSRGR